MAGLTPQLPLTRDSLNGYMLITTYKELVKQNFRNLMFTVPGERVMDLDFGIGLKRYLFEMDDPSVYSRISGRINQQVSTYLPYISITDIQFNSAANNDSVDPHYLSVAITYVIVPLDTSDNLELTLPNN